MTFYFDPVYRGMVANGLGNCTKNLKAALDYIDRQMDHPETSAAIKTFFLGRTAEKNTNEVFSDALFYPLYNWQSNGPASLTEFCSVLETGDNIVAESKGPRGKVLAERWAKWSGFVDSVNQYNPEAYCEGPAPQNHTEPDCNLDARFEGVLSISWTWQVGFPPS